MENNVIEKISKLKEEDLEFYKKLISFFDLIGITTTDLQQLVLLVKTFPEFLQKINAVLEDQKIINEKYNAIIHPEKTKDSDKINPFDELNRASERLNAYGK